MCVCLLSRGGGESIWRTWELEECVGGRTRENIVCYLTIIAHMLPLAQNKLHLVVYFLYYISGANPMKFVHPKAL